MTGWAGAAETAGAVQRWRSRQSLEMGRRSAAGWEGSCDAGMTAGSGCESGSVGDGAAAVAADVAAVAAAGGAAASVGAAAGVEAGSSVMR